MDKKIKEKIYQLRKELSKYNYIYYNLDRSDISDYNFDKKLKELYLLEKKYPELYDPTSPTKKIGTNIFKSRIYHYKYKMYSIKNTYSKKEFLTWFKKISKSIHSSLSFMCELKYDGVSINLIYKKGFLTHAVTRGNGEKGENVINNIRTIKSIPLKLVGCNYPNYIEIRGEIFISIKNFIKINKERIKNGTIPYTSPRYTASGTLKIINNIKEVRKRGLSCIAFHAIGENLPFNSQYEAIKNIKNWGFKVPEPAIFCKKVEKVLDFIDFWSLFLHKLPYQIDGIVIKINDLKKQSILGYTRKYPRWSIAYKFRQKLSETKLLSITFQVGRTGIITPVANVAPIHISGTTIKRVTLYNKRFIQNMNIHYGDTILLEKAGNIIPKITKINKNKRLINAFPVLFLKNCPSCNSSLIKKNELFYCTNKNCHSKIIEKIKHFVSEKAMDIKKIGYKMIIKLHKNGLLYNFYNLYQLKKETLIKISGIKEKLANNIIDNIEKSKKKPYDRVLYALGIRYVGEDISKKLTKYFFNINSLMSTNYDHLTSITGIGIKIAKSIINYFSITDNQHIVKMLIKYGLHLEKCSMIKKSSYFEGKSFVFTGKLSCMTRNKAKNMIEILGGRVYNTVNNNIDFIVVGKNFGSKLKKSMKIKNIQILKEKIFIDELKKTKKIDF
ncbi:NAD-dependent DNA ligase LigA [Blattabacterium cuenoti]|uniref:NAD-dependent DNA ligase LigA n=1 Tax=Blattabacterium cuenoti TaxID=1653831 RepID=UPI00163C1163|nr:NAD-dependent DNA ligase LigA [Blattabacterium cuenoti]